MSRLLVTRFHLLLLGVMVAITATGFAKIAANAGLPVHWGLDGEPDRIWPRDPALLALPIVAVALTAVFVAIGLFSSKEQLEGGRTVLEVALAGGLGVLCALQFGLLLIGTGSDIDMVRVVAVLVALLAIALGVALPRSQPNVYVGVRLPWTLRDPANWRATHQLTGGLYVLAGVALMALAWLWPEPGNLVAGVVLAMVVPAVIGSIYSFVLSRR